MIAGYSYGGLYLEQTHSEKKMKSFRTYSVVAVLAFLLGVMFGWKIYKLRVSRLKNERDYHTKKAKELEQKI